MSKYKKSIKINQLAINYDLCVDFEDTQVLDSFMGLIEDYCKTSRNERIVELVNTKDSVGASKIFNLVDNHNDSTWYYSTDSDIWYFNEIVTRTMLDYGYFSEYMEMIFSLETIPNLRSEIVKYTLANWEWISAIYHPDLLDYVAEIYSKLSLKNSRIEEEALRSAFIKKASKPKAEYRKYDKNDPVVRKAVEICLEYGKYATSLLQPQLGKGHSFIAGLGLWFEDLGIIGPVNENKPREVLIKSMAEFDKLAEEKEDIREFRDYDWEGSDKKYRKFGDMVFRGEVMYNYDDNCWRYAPDLYEAYWIDGAEMDDITKKEAKEIVERNGGTNFDKIDKVLFVSENGKFVGFE